MLKHYQQLQDRRWQENKDLPVLQDVPNKQYLLNNFMSFMDIILCHTSVSVKHFKKLQQPLSPQSQDLVMKWSNHIDLPHVSLKSHVQHCDMGKNAHNLPFPPSQSSLRGPGSGDVTSPMDQIASWIMSPANQKDASPN